MEFYDVVRNRKTIRIFSSRAVEEEKITRILKAGLAAPTHNHLREWEFILIKDYKIRLSVMEIAEKIPDNIDMNEIKETYKNNEETARKMYLEAIPLQKKMILTAPELLVVCYRLKKPICDCITIYELNSLASVWCCIENILLAMAAEDLYGVTYVPQNTAHIREVLSIPNDYEIPAIVPIGYAAENAVRCSQKAIDLGRKVHINKW